MLEQFKKIYAAAQDMPRWVQNCMAIALMTLRRREDAVCMQFRHQAGDRLAVAQHKSRGKTRLRIPTALRLDAVGWTVGDVVARHRDNVVLHRLLHHDTNQGRAAASPQKPTRRGCPSTELHSLGACSYEAAGLQPAGPARPQGRAHHRGLQEQPRRGMDAGFRTGFGKHREIFASH